MKKTKTGKRENVTLSFVIGFADRLPSIWMTERLIRLEAKIISMLYLNLMLCLSSHSAAVSSEEENWKAGVARTVITPDKPIWMAGYGSREHPAEGIIHHLWVKVLALEDSKGHSAVVITNDLCGFSKVMYDDICKRMQEKLGLARSQIMLNSSHTHSGPVVRESLIDYYPIDDVQMALINEYSSALEDKIIATTAEALSQMRPATLSVGEGICTFAVNRRNNSEADVPKIIKRGEPLKGPVDHSVPVLAVRTTDDELSAIVFGYACHSTTLSSYLWCGDYAGFTQIALENKYPGTTAMFYAGCGADQNPLPRRSVELCERYGNMLATAVDEVLEKQMRPISADVHTSFEFVMLDFERNSTIEELKGYAPRDDIRGRWARRMLKKLEDGGSFETTYPYPIMVWKLGNQLWISLASEVVVDYSLMFKSKYGPKTWVSAYSNDMMAYIPSRRVYDEGGYEGSHLFEYGLPAERWSADVEARIVAGVEQLVRKVLD